MNIKALITTLAIVGSSSVAMARPVSSSSSQVSLEASASWNFGYGTRPTVRDHRTTPTQYTPVRTVRAANFQNWNRDTWNDRYAPRFDLLADDLNFGSGEYRKDIAPGITDRFSKIKIDADQGRTYIMKVVVEFADGTSQQQIDLKKTLRAGESLTLDLTGNSHLINRIMVYRADNYDLTHFNEVHRGEFSVSAL